MPCCLHPVKGMPKISHSLEISRLSQRQNYHATVYADTGNGSFVNILGSIGAWVGSSTVQHMTGLSLTRPYQAALGPSGFIGAFGIFQVGLKAAMNAAQLSAFGWSADQSPARGVREALTVDVSETDMIHFGFSVDRQQVHLRPLNTLGTVPGWQEDGSFQAEKQKETDSSSSLYHNNFWNLSVVGANGMMKNVAINCKFKFANATYHSNMTWLGRRDGSFVNCDAEQMVYRQLWAYYFVTISLCVVLVSAFVIGEVFMITGAILVSDVQVAVYAGLKLFTIFLLHTKFLLEALPNMPGKRCQKRCVPARVRIYRQKRSTSSGEYGTCFVYCERAYRVVQGIAHPSLESTNKYGFSYFTQGGEGKNSASYGKVKYLKIFVQSVEVLAAVSGLVFLFFYAWYVSWLADKPRDNNHASFKLYIWSALEYIWLGCKILLLTLGLSLVKIHHGEKVNLRLSIDSSTGSIEINDQELQDGALVEASGKHILKANAYMAYQFQYKLSSVHLGSQADCPTIGFFHVSQQEYGKSKEVQVLMNLDGGVGKRVLNNPSGTGEENHFAIAEGLESKKTYIGLVTALKGLSRLEGFPREARRIRTFSISVIEQKLWTGKSVSAVAMHTELEELDVKCWYEFSSEERSYTDSETNVKFEMEPMTEGQLRAILLNRKVFEYLDPEKHGMCSHEKGQCE